MKKQLLTTTAAGGLAALMAVPAAAQDAEFGFDGFARMGATYDDTSEEFAMDNRFQLDASFSVVADAGLTFGGKVRMRADEESTGVFNAPVISASTGGLTLSVGNIAGVIFNTPSSFVGTGLTGNGSSGTAVYFQADGGQSVTPVEYSSTGTGQDDGVQLDYAMSGVSVSVMNSDDSSGVSFAYSQGGVSIGAAYQSDDVAGGTDDTLTVFGASYTIDAVTVGAAYAIADVGATAGDATKFSINGSYAFNDATSVSAFFASEDNGVNDGESYGLSFSRAIGGGVTAVAGWEQNAAETNFISAGVTMNF